MRKQTCTIKELYEYFKQQGKEDYKIFVQCTDIDGSYAEGTVGIDSIRFRDDKKEAVI